jgi:hypothetical protein
VGLAQASSSGFASIGPFPDGLSLTNPPVATCWISSAASGPFLALATQAPSYACALQRSSTDGRLYVNAIMPAFWYLLVVAIY